MAPTLLAGHGPPRYGQRRRSAALVDPNAGLAGLLRLLGPWWGAAGALAGRSRRAAEAAAGRGRPLEAQGLPVGRFSASSTRTRSLGATARHARRLEAALRDRVASTPKLSQDLKEECLERLDQIRETIPPEALRRPTWIHCRDDSSACPSMDPHQADREAPDGGRGSQASSMPGSVASTPTVTTLRPQSQTSRGVEPGAGTHAALAASAGEAAGEAGATPRGPGRLRVQRPPKEGILAGDDPGELTPSPRRPPLQGQKETPSGWSEETGSLSSSTWPTWRCTAKVYDFKAPRPAPKRPERLAEVTSDLQSLNAASRSVSVPVLAPPPPARQVVEARRAVAAARDALAWLGPADGGAEAPALPVRGTGSLLRTSLRYVLQT